MKQSFFSPALWTGQTGNSGEAPWLYVVLLVIPIGGLIGLLILNGKATRILRDAGLRVGLMGVKRSDLNRFQSGNI